MTHRSGAFLIHYIELSTGLSLGSLDWGVASLVFAAQIRVYTTKMLTD